MRDKLLIIGASGHGKVIADIAMRTNLWKTIEFIDDKHPSFQRVMNIKVIGTTDLMNTMIDQYDFFIGIGNNQVRRIIFKKLEELGANLPSLIHPDSVIGANVEIGAGTVIMAGAIVNCCTRIGKGCIINTAATVDHDNDIGDFVHLSPGVHTAGEVKIGEGSWLGIGSVVVNGLNITNNCVIGAGAVVIRDLYQPGTYIGLPARRIDDESFTDN